MLTFNDYVGMLPAEWIFDRVLKKSGSRRKIISSSAIREGCRDFSRPEALARGFEALAPDQRLTCSLAYLSGEAGIAASETAAGLNDHLLCSFLVYAARRDGGAVRYFGFNEFEPHLRAAMARELSGRAVRKNMARPHPLRRERMLSDLTVVVTLACQGVLQKKKQGGLLRSAVQKMAQLTGAHDTAGGSDCLAGLLTECAVGSGLLVENDEAYRCVPEACDAWMQRPVPDRIRETLDLTVRIAGGWRMPLLQEIVRLAHDGWLSTSLFPEEDRKRASEVVAMLAWAGIVVCTRHGGELLFGRPRELDTGEPYGEGVVTVMPDFSVVIAQEASPLMLYRFGHCGSLQSLDCIYKGVVDRAIVSDSLARGLGGELLLGWLAGWGAPPNVMVTVREWIREFNRLYISDHSMLVAGEERVAGQIDAYAPIRDLVEKVPVHAVYRIRQGSEGKVREILSSMGFDPRMPWCDDDPLSGEPPGEKPLSDAVWEPVVTEKSPVVQKPLAMRGTKYGAGLNTYDLSETMHVIDYALLTGQRLVFEYAGSALVKRGMYSVTPLSCLRGGEPQVEAVDGKGKKRKFLVGKVVRIGVGTS
ncbi:MAG: hypothetical protein JXA71_12145 [Chitinispirillaceae bacterium]|nr:hypothetical protein [Chitinispirillaceae bacterium]